MRGSLHNTSWELGIRSVGTEVCKRIRTLDYIRLLVRIDCLDCFYKFLCGTLCLEGWIFVAHYLSWVYFIFSRICHSGVFWDKIAIAQEILVQLTCLLRVCLCFKEGDIFYLMKYEWNYLFFEAVFCDVKTCHSNEKALLNLVNKFPPCPTQGITAVHSEGYQKSLSLVFITAQQEFFPFIHCCVITLSINDEMSLYWNQVSCQNMPL